MDTLHVDIDIRELSIPAHIDTDYYVSENQPKNNVNDSSADTLLKNSGEENAAHDTACHKVSPAKSNIDAGCQVDKQCDLKKMENGADISGTESACKTQLADTILANKREYGNMSAYDSEINTTTTSVIQQGQVRFQELLKSISSARTKEDNPNTVKLVRSRVPPKWINFEPCKFSMTRAPDSSSIYFEEPQKPQKVLSWNDANSSRPSLSFDMDGPGPCTYSPRNKPLTETNAPVYSFGGRHYSEKIKRPRTSGMGPGLRSNRPRNTKGTFTGKELATMSDAPAYSFGHRRGCSFVKQDTHMDPSPNEYSRQRADKLILRRGPSFTLQFRREGTLLWNTAESNPGPAAYRPVVLPRIRKPA